jgi:replication factor C subunit 3/5
MDELIAHEEIISIISRLIESGKLPHLLFYGPPGTGKTSTILAAARSMYGAKTNSMALELNASDDRGIGVVRDQIKSFAGTKQVPPFSQIHVLLLLLKKKNSSFYFSSLFIF